MKIVYMGTPDFAVPPLKRLHESGFDIAAVVTQPDKPKGRHGELSMPEVKRAALELGIPVMQPDKASDPEFIGEIRAMDPDVIVVAAYGQILKPELLSIPLHGCINIHASLLPRWRGASPIAMSIMEGLPESTLEIGVTLVNLATLYDSWQQGEERVRDCLLRAWDCFEDPGVRRNAYYAFNCRKCAGTFGYYGFFFMEEELRMRAEEIYQRNRKEQDRRGHEDE